MFIKKFANKSEGLKKKADAIGWINEVLGEAYELKRDYKRIHDETMKDDSLHTVQSAKLYTLMREGTQSIDQLIGNLKSMFSVATGRG